MTRIAVAYPLLPRYAGARRLTERPSGRIRHGHHQAGGGTARLGEAGDAHRNDNPTLVKALYKERPVTGARRYRRALPPATWLVSTIAAA